jgi:hypothetical protein
VKLDLPKLVPMASKPTTVESVRFAVLDRPVCVWDPLLDDTNLRFLRGLDAGFFLHQAKLMSPSGDSTSDEDSADLRNALALRISFGMALEALFAVIGAVIQAPECVFGWLSSYRNDELLQLVRRINNGEPVRTHAPFRPVTWDNISSQILLPLVATSEETHQQISARFAETWRQFAHIFVHQLRSIEYNSLKHGFRVQPSGFTITVTSTDDEEPALQSKSQFGHMLHFLKKNEGRKSDFSVSRAVFSLEPATYAAALSLIGHSINNLIAFARMKCGDEPSQLLLSVPTDDRDFKAVEALGAPVQIITYGGTTTPERYFTDEEILAVYDEGGSEV